MLNDNYDIWEQHQAKLDKMEANAVFCVQCNERITDILFETPKGPMCESCADNLACDIADDYRMDLLNKWDRGKAEDD